MTDTQVDIKNKPEITLTDKIKGFIGISAYFGIFHVGQVT